MNYCPNCGVPCSADNRFCPVCGKQIQKEKICSQCGISIGDRDLFCPRCGASTSSAPRHICEPTSQLNKKNTKKSGSYFPIILIVGLASLLFIGGWTSEGSPDALVDDTGLQETHYDNTDVTESSSTSAMVSPSQEESYSPQTTDLSLEFKDVDYVYEYLVNQRFRDAKNLVELRYDGSCQLYINDKWNALTFHVVNLQPKQAIIKYNSPTDGTMTLIVRIVGNEIQVQDPIDGTIFYQVKSRYRL